MKKCLTLLFLLTAFVAFAQPKIHSITTFTVGKEKQKTVQLFDYQDNGLTINQQSWAYKRVDSTPILTFNVVQRFRTDGRLISEEAKYFDKSKLGGSIRIDNKYDANGCLVENRRFSQSEYTKDSRLFLIQTKTNAKCQILEETLTQENDSKSQSSIYKSVILKKYEYDNMDSVKAIRYFYKDSTISFGFVEFIRRADGKIIEKREENSCDFCIDNDIPSRFFTEFNASGQIIVQKRKNLVKNILMDSTIWAYNTNGKLSRDTRFSFDFNGKISFKTIIDYTYTNYCDNLLKEQTSQYENQDFILPLNVFKKTFKTIYTYTEAPNCDKKDLLDFTIAPNPTNWHTTIQSEALTSANTTVTIYNLAGAIVRTFKVNFRTNAFDFSTIDLINGTYLVRLTDDKNSVTKKMVVLH
jgi:hypothetical protein